MNKIAVIYLCRQGNPPNVSKTFLKSLIRHRAGVNFELIYLLKGFSTGDRDAGLIHFANQLPCPVHEMRVSEEFFMLHSLRQCARELPHELILPLVSYSQIQSDDWLHSFTSAFDGQPNCLVAGATASCGSNENLPTTFPNYHIRTTGFLINRKTFLEIQHPPLLTKLDEYSFESGPRNMTQQLRERGGQAVVVGKIGKFWTPETWHESNTFWAGRQENLLIADNQTIRYETGNYHDRRSLAKSAWNDESLAKPLTLRERLRRFYLRTPQKLLKKLGLS